MNRTLLIKRLREERGTPFLSVNDVAHALRIGKARAKTILANTDYLDLDDSRRYFIDDIADAVLTMRRR